MAKKDNLDASVEVSAETKAEAERMAREYFEFPRFKRYETLYLVPYEGGFHCLDDLEVAKTFGKPLIFQRKELIIDTSNG